jgi:SAM-dependent methyltransferase
MMPQMVDETITAKVAGYYSKRLAEHGPTPRGVDWNSPGSQQLRFAKLLEIVDAEGPFSINDYGCGYGAMAEFLEAGGAEAAYHGFDIAEDMIRCARERHAGPGRAWTSDRDALEPADYTVASGIFNVRLDVDEGSWRSYVLSTLDQISALSRRGFAFNMLTAYADADKMRDDLYYADPSFFFEHCVERFGRNVALLHDYPLYEFTLLVRLADGMSPAAANT